MLKNKLAETGEPTSNKPTANAAIAQYSMVFMACLASMKRERLIADPFGLL
jgi:hypothetical protein